MYIYIYIYIHTSYIIWHYRIYCIICYYITWYIALYSIHFYIVFFDITIPIVHYIIFWCMIFICYISDITENTTQFMILKEFFACAQFPSISQSQSDGPARYRGMARSKRCWRRLLCNELMGNKRMGHYTKWGWILLITSITIWFMALKTIVTGIYLGL